MTTKYEWYQWCGSDILRNKKTERNAAWVQVYPDLGYTVGIWDEMDKDWIRIATVPDLESAKMIARMNVEGALV